MRKLSRVISAIIACAALLPLFVPQSVSAATEMPNVFVFQAELQTYYSLSGLMDMQGNIVLPAEYINIETLWEKGDNALCFSVSKVSEDGGSQSEYARTISALVDGNGKFLTDFKYDYIGRLNDGYYLANKYDYDEFEKSINIVLDTNGNEVFSFSSMDSLTTNTNGYLHIAGYYTTPMLIALDASFNEVNSIELEQPASLMYVNLREDDETWPNDPYFVSYSPKGTKLVGLMDLDMNPVFPCEYDYIHPLRSNLFAVRKDGSEGSALADENGTLLTGYDYSSLYAYSATVDIIEASSIIGEALLLAGDGRELTEPGEFQYFNTWMCKDAAIGYGSWDMDNDLMAIIYPSGERYEIRSDAQRSANVISSEIVLFAPEDGADRTMVDMLNVKTGQTVKLSMGDMEIDSCYGTMVGDNSFIVNAGANIGDDYKYAYRLFDKSGKPLSDVMSTMFTSGNYIVAEGGTGNLTLFGLFDLNGNEVIPFRYSSLQWIATREDVFMARMGRDVGYIDSSGEWIYKRSAYALLDD